jgi:hypothetical protein
MHPNLDDSNPTVGIGFQSTGERPDWTKLN